MPVEVVMPRLSDTMEEGTVLKWLHKEGEEVKKGEPLLEVATDKANMELEAYDSGTLEQITVGEGQTVPVGTQIALIRKPGEKGVAAAAPREAAPAAKPEAPAVAEAPAAAPAPPAEEVGERIKASPLARRLAEEHGVDLSQIPGTGPGGRITKEDVDEHLAQRGPVPAAAPAPTAPPPPAPPAGAREVPLTRMQDTIVRRMVESKTTVPHFYVTMEVDMGEAGRLRKAANEAAGGAQEISYNDIVVKAAALALRRFPEVNASYREGRILMNDVINVGIAVALAEGLVVPVIHDVDKKTLRQIASDAKEAIERARTGRLAPDDYVGGTFTVSNLGMFDVDEFSAIINPPQSGILAVGSVKPKPVVLDGEVKVADRMRVTLSADHRVYYGATAAQFLKEVKRLLESPLEILL
jgi:pyruvate dehydrogenase E2 component (dihydrolipoamide acetyltransferase)